MWEKPLADIAESFGATDVELAAVCRKLNVPIPSRDHWSLQRSGATPKVWKLPRTAKQQVAVIGTRPIKASPAPTAEQSATEAPSPKAPSIKAATESARPHPLTRKTQAYFLDVKRRVERHAKRRPGAPYPSGDWPPHADHGRYWCGGEDGYPLLISLAQVERVLGILDGLTKGLIREGFLVVVREPDHPNRHDRSQPRLAAEMKGERLHYRLYESYSQRRYSAKEQAEAKKASRYIGRVEYIPNGTLVFELSGSEYRIKQTFRETNAKTFDLDLPTLVNAFVDAVLRQKALREERLAEERARQVEASRRWQEEHRLRQEKEQVEALLDEASRARRFAELRSYLATVEREATQGGGMTAEGRTWLDEARRLVEMYDPLQIRLDSADASRVAAD